MDHSDSHVNQLDYQRDLDSMIISFTCKCEGPRRPPYVLGCGRLELVVKMGKNIAGDGGFLRKIDLFIYMGDPLHQPQNEGTK